MRLRTLLLIVTGLVIVPGFLAAAIAVWLLQDAARDAATRELEEAVRSTALLVDGEVKQSLGTMRALGLSAHLEAGDFDKFYEEAKAVNQPPDMWTLLLDDTGRQILNTSVPMGSPAPSRMARERVAEVIAGRSLYASDIFTGPLSGKKVTTLYWPVRTRSGKDYVLAQAFAVGHWKRAVIDPVDRPVITVAVIDKAGRFIARNKNADGLIGEPARPELVAAARSAADGTIRHKTLEGVDAYDSFAHSQQTGWTVAVATPVSVVDAAATRAVMWLATGVGLALFAAIGAALHLGRRFIASVDVASLQASRIGRGDDMPVAIPKNTIKEIQTLHHALARAARVVEAERRSRSAVESERHRLFLAEQSLRESAEAENAAKDKYLAMLGHELRNPLAAISAAAEVLIRRQDDGREVGRFAAVIQRQSGHLTQVVDDLLDVARMMAGKVDLHTGAIDLGHCVSDCVDDLRRTPMALQHPIAVQAQKVWVQADAVRLEQIVINLVTNAVKYSAPGAPVSITVRDAGARAELEVMDAGIGIHDELMPRIFQPFVQGPARPGSLASGLGIGLALVDQLVALHGGTVSAANNRPGPGCTFTVSLPKVDAPAPAAESPAPGPAKALTILLVEDNLDAMEAMRALLEMEGCSVAGAADGEAALRCAESGAFDAVVLDIGLPGRDGHEVAADLRRRFGAALRIIALSGYGHAANKASGAGLFDAYLTKPVDPDRLLAALEKPSRGEDDAAR
jgi:signal transduction histidine kinase/ActR/RegA family two-component response regulator